MAIVIMMKLLMFNSLSRMAGEGSVRDAHAATQLEAARSSNKVAACCPSSQVAPYGCATFQTGVTLKPGACYVQRMRVPEPKTLLSDSTVYVQRTHVGS